MKVVSIIGGVGSGKSEVLRVLREEFDAQVILADEVAHQLMEQGKSAYQKVTEELGTSFLNTDGSINRKKLAELIFRDEQALARINAIVHPMVWKEIRAEITRSDKALVVVEAALFDEEHNAMFDEIWYVYTSAENRIRRLMESRGYTKEKCLDMMKSQASEDEYRSLAAHVLDNNGGIEAIHDQIAACLSEEAAG